MMAILVIIGVVTIFGTFIIGAIETRRTEKGQPDIITSLFKKKDDKSQQKAVDTLRL